MFVFQKAIRADFEERLFIEMSRFDDMKTNLDREIAKGRAALITALQTRDTELSRIQSTAQAEKAKLEEVHYSNTMRGGG